MSALGRLRRAARRLKAEVGVLLALRRDARVPLAARVVIVLTVAYALSPIDLIPDVIPVLGLLDDLLIVPAGVWLALRLVPPAALAEARRQSGASDGAELGRLGGAIVVATWVGTVVAVWALWT